MKFYDSSVQIIVRKYMKNSGLKPVSAILICLVIVIFTTQCFQQDSAQVLNQAESQGKITVFVSILPQVYFVERIAGQRVDVKVLVKPGKSPTTYAPTLTQLANLVKAKVFFRIGVPFENVLLPKVKEIARNLKIVDTRLGIKLRKMQGSHDHNDSHTETKGDDPHIWLSPQLVKQQAKIIGRTLMQIDPEGKAEYTDNLQSFIIDLEALDRRISKVLSPFKGSTFFVFHPTFGYFADAYGLRQMAVEVEGKAPKGKELALFIKKAKADVTRLVFVQPQFDQTAAQKIAEAIQGAVISIDPLSGDYIQNLEIIATKIANSFKR